MYSNKLCLIKNIRWIKIFSLEQIGQSDSYRFFVEFWNESVFENALPCHVFWDILAQKYQKMSLSALFNFFKNVTE